MTGIRPCASSTVTFTTSSCSAAVREYISPVPPAATMAAGEFSMRRCRFLRSPGISKNKSGCNGVIGNAITPRSLARSSSGFICSPTRTEAERKVDGTRIAEVARMPAPSRNSRREKCKDIFPSLTYSVTVVPKSFSYFPESLNDTSLTQFLVHHVQRHLPGVRTFELIVGRDNLDSLMPPVRCRGGWESRKEEGQRTLFIPDSDSTPPYHLLTVGVISFSRLRFGRIRAKCGSVFKIRRAH